MEGDLRRESGVTLRGGTCWCDVSWQWLPARNDLTPRNILHKELSQSKSGAPPPTGLIPSRMQVQFVVDDTWPFRERASEQNGRLYPLRMDINNGGGGTLRQPPSRRKNKALLLDITIVKPCTSSNL